MDAKVNNKKLSVLWLTDKVCDAIVKYFDGNSSKGEVLESLREAQDTALKIHKEEIEEAFKHGKLPTLFGRAPSGHKEYYNKTFGDQY